MYLIPLSFNVHILTLMLVNLESNKIRELSLAQGF